MIQHIKLGLDPSFGARDRDRQAFVESKFDVQRADVTLKKGQYHQNLIISFPCPNCVSVQVWSKSIYWFRRQSADKAHFYRLYSVMTLKIRSRSPKSNQIF